MRMNQTDLRYEQSLLKIDYSQKGLLRLNLNENLVFPQNVMRSILAKCTDEYDPRFYPSAIGERDVNELSNEIGRYCSCSSKSVAIGVGSDQLIDLLFRRVLKRDSDSVVTFDPTFSMYSIFANRQGSPLVEVVLNPSTSSVPFSLPIKEVKQALGRKTSKLLCLVSPNNPTGLQYPLETVTQLLESFPEKTFLLDEAYVEYARYDGAKELLKNHKNLIVMRTFSKAFGLASLRLGYLLCSDTDLIQDLNDNYQYPYPVAGISILMGIEMLKRKSAVLEWAQKTKQFREELIVSLQKIGQSVRVVLRSDTNFVLVHSKNSRRIVEELLTRFGIAVKYLPKMGTEKEFLRMTVGSQEINQKLMYAMRRVVSS
jgi:histidinol-phosphate aminotransferase